MERAVFTCLNTEDYIIGVLSLNDDVNNILGMKLNVLCTQSIVEKYRSLFVYNGINYIIVADKTFPKIDDSNWDEKKQYWKNTFIKLELFRLLEYDKILYLDADLYIKEDITELFSHKALSAVYDSDFMMRSINNNILNSGVMLLEPNEKTYEALIACYEIVEEKAGGNAFGDQDIISYYFNDNDQARYYPIDISYNAYFRLLDRYKEKHFKVIHFSTSYKPWRWSASYAFYHILRHALRGRVLTSRNILEYYKKIRRIQKKLNNDFSCCGSN